MMATMQSHLFRTIYDKSLTKTEYTSNLVGKKSRVLATVHRLTF